MTLALYAYGGITEIAIANVQKREVRFRFGRAGAIFWVTILVLLMEMVFTVPLQLAKLTFIATIVDLFFTIRFGLLSQVIVAEDTNVDAIARSWNLWKGNGGFLASRMIGFYLMVIAALGVPSLVLFFSFGGITSKLNPGGAPNWPLFALVCLLIAIPALYFSLYIDPYFKARLYQQVRGRRLMVAPTPAAPSVGRELYDFNP